MHPRGRDVKKYQINFKNLFIISTFPSLKLNIDDFKEIKEYLLSFGYDRLKQEGINGSRKKTGNKWFETQDQISYYNNFNKNKIIWIELSDKSGFAFDDSKFYPLAGTWVMTGENLKYLCSILNSKLGEYYFSLISTSSGVGTNMWKKYKIEQFPIKESSNDKMMFLENLVNEILEGKKTAQDTSHLEHQIDVMVYHLYGLSYEEACVIDKELKEEDYRTSSFQLEA